MANYILLLVSSILVAVHAVTTGDSDTNCQLPLGMESGAIMNRQLSSTSKESVLQGPIYARLHRREGGGGWTPQTTGSDQYLTLDLEGPTNIVAVTTQGRFGTDKYTMKYKLQYSINGNDWTTYMDNDQEKVFVGNSNADTAHRNDLTSPIEARYIRFNPTQWNVAPSMRVELYGCLSGGDNTATFDGNSYIKYDISNPNNYIQTSEELIQFKMRTAQQDGIILASSGTQSDYIALQLKRGKLVLSIDLGTTEGKDGATVLECGSLLDDNQWHFVRYSRKNKTIRLMVDDVTITGNTNGYFKRLDLDTEMTIGGTPRPQMSGLQLEENFVGCLQDIALSNRANTASLSNALYFITAAKTSSEFLISVEGTLHYECRGDAQVAATFPTQASYLKLPGPEAGTNFTVQFKFRTFHRNGLVIYNKLQTTNRGYIAVGLKDGAVNIAIKLDPSPLVEIPGEKKYPAASSLNTTQNSTIQEAKTDSDGSGLADGRWHSVRAEVANNFIRLTVNGNTHPTQRNLDIRTGSEYFIGGSTEPEEDTGMMPGFRGCVRDVYLRDDMVDFHSIQESDAERGITNNNVNLDMCGLQDWCTPNPCEHKGQCYSDWDSFICSCRGTGYVGATCHTTDKPRACESSGSTTIDVDGSGPLAPFYVDCVKDKDGTLFTVVGHTTEMSQSVPDGHGGRGSYTQDITYGTEDHEITRDQLQTLTEGAVYCEQNIKYQCNGAKLLNSPEGTPYGWWVSVHNDKMTYWGGAAPNTGKCQCGMDLSCVDNSKYCNCDAPNAQNQVDEGLLTDKSSLPVTQLRFGDRADGSSSSAYELGKLRCRGNVYADKVVTFQSDEAHLKFPITTTEQKSVDLDLEFKTLTTGVVLLSADGPDDNFIQLEIETARTALFQVNYGAGPRSVRVTQDDVLNDDQWHRLRAVLNNQDISLQVDQMFPETAPANSSNLNIQLTSDLFVGSSTLQSDGYVGCMHSLLINGNFVDLTAEKRAGIAEGCAGQCTEDQCLNNGRCVEFYDKFECRCTNTPFEGEYCSEEIGAKLRSGSKIGYTLAAGNVQDYTEDMITLGFSTRAKQGMLLRVDGGPNGEYEQVSILPNGNIQYSFKLDANSVPQNVESKHDFTDGRHHLVDIVRTGKNVSLKVDLYKPVLTTVASVDTTFNGGNNIIIGSTDTAQTFSGCVSRVQFNGITPLRLYFGSNRPPTMSGTGAIDKSRCGVEPEIPPSTVTPTQPPMETTTHADATEVLIALQRSYKPGDKAAITIVVLLLLIALILLIVFIGRYKYKHKGVYKTNEARGAENARDADTAVMMSDTKQPKFERKKEWYI